MRLIACLVMMLLCAGAVRADDLPDKPKPNHRPEILAVIQAGVLIADGVTTRQNVTHGQVEIDPVARLFIGSRPGYGRMVPIGVIEEVGCYYLARRMERSQRFHKIYWLPQAVAIAGHGFGAGSDIR